jgi:hypothetical protein
MWILFAVLARILWACMNMFDQVLARTHPKHSALSAMIMGMLPDSPAPSRFFLSFWQYF